MLAQPLPNEPMIFLRRCPARFAFLLEDSSVDFALLVTVLGEVDDAQVTLQEIRRVLRPGGLLSVTEHLPDPDFRSAATVRSLASSQGFAERDYSGGRWSYTINFVR